MKKTNNLRIETINPLLSPAQLFTDFPMTEKANTTVADGRDAINAILRGEDSRLIGIIGPCSIHDRDAALDYAKKLSALSEKVADKMFLVMRMYFEKPRTTIGWRGLITDPHLDGSYDIEGGLKLARNLLIEISEMGLPVASEVLDPIIPQYISDLISWSAIGARTTESQTHRNMASGLSMPVGFKNGTDGNMDIAVNALESAMHSHSFIGLDENGKNCILNTTGNDAVHIILRGGHNGPNYYEENVELAEDKMKALGLNPAIIVDCSHANSGKEWRKQERVLRSIVDQKAYGRKSLVGFMLESNLFEGSQKIPSDIKTLEYGVSITDACIGWDDTEKMIWSAYGKL
ncbi:MAG: 3-deoxy-7-phosphoheptulonate synthase [Spirochaetales bacterium]|nr:3-deoxy-7-phosphoheptulonate synthase [Spirochaetales bacterium]